METGNKNPCVTEATLGSISAVSRVRSSFSRTAAGNRAYSHTCFAKKAKARFRRRTFHEPNLIRIKADSDADLNSSRTKFRRRKMRILVKLLTEGDMGVYGIAVLGFFSCGISVILILTCGIAVSSSSAVCGFSSFWLTVFG